MRIRESVIGIVLVAAISGAHAEMEPMSDQEMGDVTGQSMLGLDVAQTAEADFTRYTIGLEADFQMNMEELAVGEDASGAADVAVRQLAFGHIARQGGVQFDGNDYAAGEIVPFIGRDPYLELAEDNGNVVGFRMGFTESRGTLSGDISALTGRLGIELEDSQGNLQQGELLQADGTANNQRATHYGLSGSADCSAGVDCAALSALQTLEIGDRNAGGSAAFTNDFFISFQNKALEWQTPDGTGTVQADPGVFLNIPTAMRKDLSSLQNNVVAPRARTEYIDRGEGLF